MAMDMAAAVKGCEWCFMTGSCWESRIFLKLFACIRAEFARERSVEQGDYS